MTAKLKGRPSRNSDRAPSKSNHPHKSSLSFLPLWQPASATFPGIQVACTLARSREVAGPHRCYAQPFAGSQNAQSPATLFLVCSSSNLPDDPARERVNGRLCLRGMQSFRQPRCRCRPGDVPAGGRRAENVGCCSALQRPSALGRHQLVRRAMALTRGGKRAMGGGELRPIPSDRRHEPLRKGGGDGTALGK